MCLFFLNKHVRFMVVKEKMRNFVAKNKIILITNNEKKHYG